MAVYPPVGIGHSGKGVAGVTLVIGPFCLPITIVLDFQSPATPEQLIGRTCNSKLPHQPVDQFMRPVEGSSVPGLFTKPPG